MATCTVISKLCIKTNTTIRRYVILCILFSCSTANAQFQKRFDIAVSYGWLKCYNKKGIITEDEALPYYRNLNIEREESMRTSRRSLSLGYTFSSNHHLRLAVQAGYVGSKLTGSANLFGRTGSTPITLDNTGNIF